MRNDIRLHTTDNLLVRTVLLLFNALQLGEITNVLGPNASLWSAKDETLRDEGRIFQVRFLSEQLMLQWREKFLHAKKETMRSRSCNFDTDNFTSLFDSLSFLS
jgi:hypothetical protein